MSYAIQPQSRLRIWFYGAARAAKRALTSPLRHLPGSSLHVGPPRGIEASTAQWLKSRPESGSIQILSNVRDVARTMPRHADEPIAKLFGKMASGQIKRRAVAVLSGARFWGNSYGCVISPDDKILHDFSPTFSDFDGAVPVPARHDGLYRFKLPRLRKVQGTFAAINTFGQDNFHHWLLDSLPAFGVLKDANWKIGDFDGILLRSHTKPFNRETLARLGVPESRIVHVCRDTHLLPDRLVIPSFSEPGRQPEHFNYTPEGVDFVRSLFLDGRTASPVDADKIIVSREKTVTRRLLDGDRIHESLRREGFVKVCLEDFTVAQQAALFQRVRVVIMPTGGGLANCVFCRPETRVVELFSPAYLPTFMLPLSNALQLSYCALVGENTVGAAQHSDTGGLADISVSLERLLEAEKAV